MRAQRATQALPAAVLDAHIVVLADEAIRGRFLGALGGSRFDLRSRACNLDQLAAPTAEVPDVVVISCPAVRECLGVLARIHELPSRRVLVVAAASRSDVREAIAAGADGLILEYGLESSLPAVVEAVLSDHHLVLPRTGRWYLAPAIADQAIASQLHVAEATVKSHLNAGFRKLGVRSRAEATVRILDPRNGPGVGILSIAGKDFALDVVGVT